MSDDVILRERVAHDVLVNRPIVVTPKGVELCRPSEVVLTVLDRKPAGLVAYLASVRAGRAKD